MGFKIDIKDIDVKQLELRATIDETVVHLEIYYNNTILYFYTKDTLVEVLRMCKKTDARTKEYFEKQLRYNLTALNNIIKEAKKVGISLDNEFNSTLSTDSARETNDGFKGIIENNKITISNGAINTVYFRACAAIIDYITVMNVQTPISDIHYNVLKNIGYTMKEFPSIKLIDNYAIVTNKEDNENSKCFYGCTMIGQSRTHYNSADLYRSYLQTIRYVINYIKIIKESDNNKRNEYDYIKLMSEYASESIGRSTVEFEEDTQYIFNETIIDILKNKASTNELDIGAKEDLDSYTVRYVEYNRVNKKLGLYSLINKIVTLDFVGVYPVKCIIDTDKKIVYITSVARLILF